jgi:hypothetical protein
VEVYHLSDSANASIPTDIRAQFHRDEHDRILFFTAPPMDASLIPESTKTFGHSIPYLAAKARERDVFKRTSEASSSTNDSSAPRVSIPESAKTLGHNARYLAVKARELEVAKEPPEPSFSTAKDTSLASMKRKTSEIESESKRLKTLQNAALELWCIEMQRGTEWIYQQMHGDNWKTVMDETNKTIVALQEQSRMRNEEFDQYEKGRKEAENIRF